MRAARWMAVLVLGFATGAMAQDSGKTQDWQKMYEDASAQLRAAQDRKSELSAENTKLTARIAELEKGLQSAQDEIVLLRNQADTFAEETYLLHSFYVGWEAFARSNPPISEQLRAFLDESLIGRPADVFTLCDRGWPLSDPLSDP